MRGNSIVAGWRGKALYRTSPTIVPPGRPNTSSKSTDASKNTRDESYAASAYSEHCYAFEGSRMGSSQILSVARASMPTRVNSNRESAQSDSAILSRSQA